MHLSHTKHVARLTAWPVEVAGPGHPVPPCPQPRTFNAADDFEAAGGEPIGDEEEDGNQGGIEQAVVVQGCPLHGSMPRAPLCYLGQPCPGSPPPEERPPRAGRRGAARAGRQVIGSVV